MTITTVVLILSSLLQCVLWGVLGAFGIWLYRRVPLPSLPWIGIYLLLTSPPVFFANSLLIHQVTSRKMLPLGWSGSMSHGEFIMLVTTANNLIGTLLRIAMAALLLSEVVFLLTRAGIELDKRGVRQLLLLRELSTPIGAFIIALTLIGEFAFIAMRLR